MRSADDRGLGSDERDNLNLFICSFEAGKEARTGSLIAFLLEPLDI
jgi:hypothetical protein